MKRHVRLFVAVILVCSMLLVSCSKGGDSASSTTTGVSTTASSSQKGYAIKVGEAIFSKEYFQFIAKQQMQMLIDSGVIKSKDDEIDGKPAKQLIKDFIVDNLKQPLVMNAVLLADGFKIDEAKLEEHFNLFKSSQKNSPEVEAKNKENGLTDEILRENVRMMMFEEEYVKRLKTMLEDTEEFKNFMNAEIVEVKARHILLETEEKAKEVMELVKKGEKTFSELATEYSTDPGSGSNGGDLGYFGKGYMDPQFEQAAFALEKGAVSDVVPSQFGFHIILCEDRRTLEDMKQAGVESEKIDFAQRMLSDRFASPRIMENIQTDLSKFELDINQEFLDQLEF